MMPRQTRPEVSAPGAARRCSMSASARRIWSTSRGRSSPAVPAASPATVWPSRSFRIAPTPATGLSPSRAIPISSGNARNRASVRVRSITLSSSIDAFGPHVLKSFSEGKPSAGQRLGEKRQALVHPVIDAGVVVGELLIAMRNAKLVQPPHKPTGAIEQIELILLAAVDVKCLQPAEIARLGFDRNYRVLPQPVRPAFLDNLAGVERDRQPDAKELRRIGIVAGRHRQHVDHLAGTIRILLGIFELTPPALDGIPSAGERAQDCWHFGQIT